MNKTHKGKERGKRKLFVKISREIGERLEVVEDKVHGSAEVEENDKSGRQMGSRVMTDKLSVQAVYLARG
ncbi:unnamed protein product [Prunus armeniaca]|uniref:Uncharacterized protein n=1 Tax=Prunus armeniaca TaxID=36596 RepID=A0A6J5VN64_PRUAR|nr:unnamed protein product [Prunus armeniaca]CAB4320910.1 unnamed protein product [Prunus armeniaca]